MEQQTEQAVETASISAPLLENGTIEMRFDASPDKSASSLTPSTLNADDRTVDVDWYTGVSVPRFNYRTGQQYMLRLDMAGCRMQRLNAGAPVFDDHSNYGGTADQVGCVLKAWSDGQTGKATLKFSMTDNPDDQCNRVWSNVASGIVRNLSFGTWIYTMSPDESIGPKGYAPDDEDQEMQYYVATDWEPFEISPVCVPADFKTQFLSAQASPAVETPALQREPESTRATAQQKETPVENTQQAAGNETRQNDVQALNAAREEATKAERQRVQAIKLAAKPFATQLGEDFVDSLIEQNLTAEDARTKILEKLAAKSDTVVTNPTVSITRDQRDTVRENLTAAMLVRSDPKTFADFREKGREYAGFSLIEMARECLEVAGVKTRGMSKDTIARLALSSPGGQHFAAPGMVSTSDLPNIVSAVTNKSLRQAYEAAASNWKAFCRMVTATDFKAINRVQLSDLSALSAVNEHGGFNYTAPSDSKESYSLGTYGEIVAITRKTIINDDLQAFTRIPGLLGMAAARLEADIVWAIFTANAAMSDTVALFHATHANLTAGALSHDSLGTARTAMRKQTGPKGTILNLTPKTLILPAALEQTGEQLTNPMGLAASDATKVVNGWVRSLNMVVEPRLDSNSAVAFYLAADNSMVDTIEYCYLEGQEGVYTETRQGFDVDGVEIKARLDFGAAAVEYRGLLKSTGV